MDNENNMFDIVLNDYTKYIIAQEENLRKSINHLNSVMPREEVESLMSGCIEKLSEFEQKAVSLYFIEGLNLKELEKVMSISEPEMFTLVKSMMTRFSDRVSIYIDMNASPAIQEKSKLKDSRSLLESLDRRINNVSTMTFSLLAFEITNANHLCRYLDYHYGKKSILYAVKKAVDLLGQYELFSVNDNEIAIVLDNKDINEAYDKGQQFVDYFSDPVFINNIPVNIRINCGIVNYPRDGNESEILYQNMERALSQCGQETDIVSIYNENTTKGIKNNYKIRFKLYNALKNDELRIEYQPIYSIEDFRITKAEALLRWDDVDMGIGQVIDIAEESNLISKLTRWVTAKVIEQLEKWMSEGIFMKISINISPRDLTNDDYFTYLKECIGKSSVEANMIELEITERGVFENKENIIDLLERIRKCGFSISIDDYGTGYNSLLNALIFPTHNIKIDKCFIDNIGDDRTMALVDGLIGTAKKAGTPVIAEGVETEDQYLILKDMGCTEIQGYYVSRPLKPDVFRNLLI